MAADESLANLPDADLIARVSGGEKAAYAEVIRRHQDRLRGTLSLYYASQAETEEALQEAFVQAYVQLARYDATLPPPGASGWDQFWDRGLVGLFVDRFAPRG